MKVRIKNVNELLSEELSLRARGILITIMLLRDDDSKVTLAKVKAKLKMSEVKEDLISLHEAGWIVWSGYRKATKTILKAPKKDVCDVIEFMNKLYGRKFNPKSKSTTKFLVGRLNDYTVDEVKLVVANRWVVWKDSKMQVHLNPTTVFRQSKFEKYIEEAQRTREGEEFLNVSVIGLKHGDEITLKVAERLIDESYYNIRTFRLSPEGRKMGNGIEGRRSGKEIKKTLRAQEREVEFGNPREFQYNYRTR